MIIDNEKILQDIIHIFKQITKDERIKEKIKNEMISSVNDILEKNSDSKNVIYSCHECGYVKEVTFKEHEKDFIFCPKCNGIMFSKWYMRVI